MAPRRASIRDLRLAKEKEEAMNKRRSPLAAALPLALLLAAPLAAGAPAAAAMSGNPAATHPPAGAATAVKEFDVFVDLPTGFAFVKTPKGWTFVRKLETEQLKTLPPSTLTALATVNGVQMGTRFANAPVEARISAF